MGSAQFMETRGSDEKVAALMELKERGLAAARAFRRKALPTGGAMLTLGWAIAGGFEMLRIRLRNCLEVGSVRTGLQSAGYVSGTFYEKYAEMGLSNARLGELKVAFRSPVRGPEAVGT